MRVALDRFRWRPEPAVVGRPAAACGTALAVLNTFARFDAGIREHAARSWLGNAAAPVILLVAAAWTARGGQLRALVSRTGSGSSWRVVCLLEYFAPGSVSLGPLRMGRVLEGLRRPARRHVPSPNALSAQLIVPTMVLLAAALLARISACAPSPPSASIPMLAAHYFTFSRSPILARTSSWSWRPGAFAGRSASRRWRSGSSSGAVAPAVVPGDPRRRPGVETDPGHGPGCDRRVSAPSVGRGEPDVPRRAAHRTGIPRVPGAGGCLRGSAPRLTAQRMAALLRRGGGGRRACSASHSSSRPTVSLNRVPGWLGTGLTAGFLGYVLAASFNNPLLFLRVSAVAFPIFGVGLALAERRRARATSRAQDPNPCRGATDRSRDRDAPPRNRGEPRTAGPDPADPALH